MGLFIKQLAKSTFKLSEKTIKVDPNSPVSMDSADFILKVGKHVIDLFF